MRNENNKTGAKNMKPTYQWIKENIQVAGFSITTNDNLIGIQFVTMTHTDHDVICEINDCLLSNFPAYYGHITYGECDGVSDEGTSKPIYFLKITVWEDTGEAESYRSKCECYSCGLLFDEDEVELIELKKVFLKWKECPNDVNKWFCVDCQPKDTPRGDWVDGEWVEDIDSTYGEGA